MSKFSLPLLPLLLVLEAYSVEPSPAPTRWPNPLQLVDGTQVTTRKQWQMQGRPELKKLFQQSMYGFLPPAPEGMTARVERTDPQALQGKATLKEITIGLGPDEPTQIHLLLVTPNKRSGPAPVFVGLSFCGTHAMLNDPRIRIPTIWMYDGPGVKDHKATEEGRGKQSDVWNIEDAIDRGYAMALFYAGDVEPDRAEIRSGIQASYAKRGLVKPSGESWGTVAAWAWGIQRVIDVLVKNDGIDPKRIAVVGHSRLGKATLLAAALDERIALAIPHQAGCGGTAPSRGKVGESVKQINDRFPHWFCGNFKQFNDHPERLPFDQHCLVALVAPRPVLFSNAVEDTWANPDGQFEVLKAADPVYRLLNAGGLDAKEKPPVGELLASKLGYFIRPGQHSMNRTDWKAFLDFADKQLGK